MFDAIAIELRLAFVALGDHRAVDAITARDSDRARSLLDQHMRDGLRICLTNRV